MHLEFILEVIGTIAFAISGVLAAFKKRMDLFGVFIIAFVTAAGGGSLRDVLMGKPVTWMGNPTFIYVIAGAATLGLIFRKKLGALRKSLFLFDTIGLGLFTITGVAMGYNEGLPFIICVALGTITASFGGVIRDILCNEIPIIFRKEIYATACIAGGTLYFFLRKTEMPLEIISVLSGLLVIAIRLLAVRFKWSLPNIYTKEELNQ